MTTRTNGRRTIEIFTAAELMRMELPEPKWAVPGMAAVGLTLLVGKGKIGKSWLVLDLGLGVACGGAVLGSVQVDPGSVLYIAAEDTKRRLQERHRKVLRGQPAPERLTLAVEWPRQGEGGCEAIGAWLERHADARLVIVDTFAKFRRRRDGKASYMDDYDDAAELKALGDRHGIGVVVVHHARKADAADILDEVSGSIGLTGAADSTLVLKRDRGQADAYLFQTGRDIDERELALRFDGTTGLWTILGIGEEYRLSRERTEILVALREAVVAQTPKEVAELVDRRPGAVRKLMWAMSREGQIRCVGSGRYVLSGNTGNTGNIGETGIRGTPGTRVTALP